MVDALNMKMHVMHLAISTSSSNLKDKIKEANDTDRFFQQVKEGLQQQETTHKFVTL